MTVGHQVGRSMLEADWIYTTRSERLHHVELADDEAAIIFDDSQLEEVSVRATCGRLLWWISIPGLGSRLEMPRCKGCCDRLGYPHGNGSPKNDPTCEAVLDSRLKGLGA